MAMLCRVRPAPRAPRVTGNRAGRRKRGRDAAANRAVAGAARRVRLAQRRAIRTAPCRVTPIAKDKRQARAARGATHLAQGLAAVQRARLPRQATQPPLRQALRLSISGVGGGVANLVAAQARLLARQQAALRLAKVAMARHQVNKLQRTVR